MSSTNPASLSRQIHRQITGWPRWLVLALCIPLLSGARAAQAPRKSEEFRQLQAVLTELTTALLPLQQESGMWRTLLHRPAADSPAETNGTALIVTAFPRAWREKLLDDLRLRDSAREAFAALPACVDELGVVLGTSPGPGPLQTETPCLAAKFRPDDPHGTFAVLFAAAEALRLEEAIESGQR